MFLLSLAVTSLNISAVRSSVTPQYQRAKVGDTEEKLMRMTLFIAFILGIMPVYKLVIHVKAQSVILASMLLSAYSLLLFGPS